MKNLIEKTAEGKEIWTVTIGDDKYLLSDNTWGTLQDAKNVSGYPLAVEYWTKEEAQKKADMLNEENYLTYKLNKYRVELVAKFKFDLKNLK